ncbi:MAG: arginine--tRNA ligase, partial [Desulfurococcaceae archaeon]
EELYSILGSLRKLTREYLEYSRAEKRISIYYPDLYSVLKSSIKNHFEAEREINRLMLLAESEDPGALSLFREVSSRVLDGFIQSLKVMGIEFNGFDFESSSIILRRAHEIVESVAKTGFARVISGGALEVDLNTLASVDDRVKKLFYPDQAGRFIIRRSDGTTLYVTRDIAYSIYKFKDLGANIVYNVIAVEQSREQKQLKAMLYLLGYPEYAENMHHFAYEMVHLKGMRMSGRRGIYYTIDEMIIDAKLKILDKLLEKTQMAKVDMIDVAEKLSIANTRAILLSVEPSKVLVFDPERINEIEYGTMIEYSFVRLLGIIRNLWNLEYLENPGEVHTKVLKTLNEARKVELSIEEKRLVEDLLRFKYTLIEAYREMKPNKIIEYAITISLDFNKFYEMYPIITERDENKKRVRVLITALTLFILSELLDILGFPKLSMM